MTAARRKLREAARAQNMTTRSLNRAIEINLTVIRAKDPARADALKDRMLDKMIAGEQPYDPTRNPRHSK